MDSAQKETEKEILDNVIKSFDCYSGKILEEMTHNEAPWIKTRIGLNDRTNSNSSILIMPSTSSLNAVFFPGSTYPGP